MALRWSWMIPRAWAMATPPLEGGVAIQEVEPADEKVPVGHTQCPHRAAHHRRGRIRDIDPEKVAGRNAEVYERPGLGHMVP